MHIDTSRSRTGVCAHCTTTAKQAHWSEFKTPRPWDGKQRAECTRVSTVAWRDLPAVIDVSVTCERKIKQLLGNVPPAQVSGSHDGRAEQIAGADRRQSQKSACAAKSNISTHTVLYQNHKALKSKDHENTWKQSVEAFCAKMQR